MSVIYLLDNLDSFSYNLVDRKVEQRLLPLAADRGMAVLVNRPFQEGALVRRLQRHALPAWAGEIGCRSWAQVGLKFILSHPAVTCVIPATTRVDHVQENLAAATGAERVYVTHGYSEPLVRWLGVRFGSVTGGATPGRSICASNSGSRVTPGQTTETCPSLSSRSPSAPNRSEPAAPSSPIAAKIEPLAPMSPRMVESRMLNSQT